MPQADITVEVSGVEIPVDTMESLLDAFEDIDEGSNYGVREDGYAIYDDGDPDDAFHLYVNGDRRGGYHFADAVRSSIEDVQEEANEPDAGFYVRVESTDDHGFEIPLSEADQFALEYDGTFSDGNPHNAAWNTDVDVADDLDNDGSDHDFAEEHPNFDGHAIVSEVEIIERK